MENAAKNKAILLSPWGTTGQYLCQTAANFLSDYFRKTGFLLGHIQANKTSQGPCPASTRVACRLMSTHAYIHSSLTCFLIDLSVSGTNYGSGGEERETKRQRRQSCSHP